MRRDKLELADDSLFIERIKHTFAAADAELVIRAHAVLSEKACADDSTAHNAAAMLVEQDADAIAVVAALQLRRRDIHVILSSIGSVPRKALLFIIFRLLALQKAIGSSGMLARKMAQDTLDLLVPIADRLGLGDLRRRLEDTCFRLLDPAGYERLKENVAPIQAEDDRCLRILTRHGLSFQTRRSCR